MGNDKLMYMEKIFLSMSSPSLPSLTPPLLLEEKSLRLGLELEYCLVWELALRGREHREGEGPFGHWRTMGTKTNQKTRETYLPSMQYTFMPSALTHQSQTWSRGSMSNPSLFCPSSWRSCTRG